MVLALGLSALGFTYRKEIYFLFAKDQSVRAEKTKEKTIELWKSGNLKEKDIEDFQSIATTYSEKDPTDPIAFHLIARSLYWNLNRLGIQFDHDSLILHLGSSFREFIGSSVLAESTLDSIFWNARTAEAYSSSQFSDWENNRVLLFLGETHRGVKRPQVLVGEYGNLDRSKLSLELQSVYIWLLTFNTMLAGDAAGLDHLITITKDPNYKIGIHFSPREENFLRGLGKYYKKDYVGALSLLRQAKTNNPDRITETSIITEATIFHLQNLSQKGIDLLEEFYLSNGKKNTDIPILITKFMKEKPGLKTKLDLTLDKKE
ncbi:hypothetical protein EHQ43_07910 [Leptospira bouyouniensis]|uniref:Tetratricopeptide repeat protein n=1 Tax=Leptospira bouyouniensis TaxID=2484911 RepID=A0A7I0IRQ1_9LEPT|nr:hypothetical protein EHQ43_07910 [Leptospira bouyouniensis]TGM81116.1 hypothetical protein EHQ99_07485 [Leptospira bouyouniensis]